jgi:hypothetical protein
VSILCVSYPLCYQTYCGTWRKSKSDGVDDSFRFKCPLSCPPLCTTTRKSAMGDNLNLHTSVNQMDPTIPCATLLESPKNDYFVFYIVTLMMLKHAPCSTDPVYDDDCEADTHSSPTTLYSFKTRACVCDFILLFSPSSRSSSTSKIRTPPTVESPLCNATKVISNS